MTVQAELYGNGRPRLVQRLGIVPFLCYLTAVAMLHALYYCPERVLTLCNLVAYAWGGLLGVALLIEEQPYRPTHKAFPLFVLVSSFLLAYLLTILVNPQKMENLKGLASMSIQLLVVFFYLSTLDRKQSKRLLTLVCSLMVAMTFLASAISLVLYVINRIPPVMENRFAGIYINPNTLVVGLLSLFLSVYFLITSRRLRWFHGLNILVQLMVTTCSASRAIEGLLILFILLLSLLALLHWLKRGQKGKAILLALAICTGGFLSLALTQWAVPYLQVGVLHSPTSTMAVASLEAPDIPPRPSFTIVTRPEEEQAGSSQVRFNMIKAGFHTFTNHPLLGVGVRNLAAVVQAENPYSVVIGIENGGLHNTYLQLLVANGAIGFLLMLALALYCLKVVLFWNQKKTVPVWFFVIYAVCICAHGLFEVSFLFSNSLTALTFWTGLGYLMSQSVGARAYPQLLHSVPQGEEGAE